MTWVINLNYSTNNVEWFKVFDFLSTYFTLICLMYVYIFLLNSILLFRVLFKIWTYYNQFLKNQKSVQGLFPYIRVRQVASYCMYHIAIHFEG